MNRWLFISILLMIGTISHAQENMFSYVDDKMISIPKNLTNSTDDIAGYIQSHFKNDAEKCRAAYRWVTYNIRYDADSMYSFNWGGDPERKITAALRRHKGVCENFAAVFNEIVSKCGIRSFIVSGYTKQSGNIIDKIGHSWCAVNINNEWLFCDPTWDEAYRSTTNYFLISPSAFIETHMPFDPLWQLLDQPVSRKSFSGGNISFEKNEPAFHFADSINAFLQLSEVQKLESSIRRIRNAGIANELTRIQLSFLEMQAGIFYEDRDMNLYNAAVENLNKASDFFNNFVQYRNKQFTPSKPDSEITDMLTPVEAQISVALMKAKQVEESPMNAQYNTEALKDRLYKLAGRVQEQKNFLQKYFSLTGNERQRLFYN